MNRGVQEFYYTRFLPSRAVAIAQVRTAPYTPAQLTDIHNTPYQVGTYNVWLSTSDPNGAADFTAKDYNVPLTISGDSSYYLDNILFELSNQQSANNVALFYYHLLPDSVTDVKILDLDGNVVDAELKMDGNYLYHDLGKNAAYRVRYVDSGGFMQERLLQAWPVLLQTVLSPGENSYVLSGRILQVSSTAAFYIRFLSPGGYQVLAPYDSLPNVPWFPRIRYGIKPLPQEWAKQVFLPERPYMLATWVPGKVLASHIVEFERKAIYYDPDLLPDILVFDKDNAIKYALEGSAPGSPRRRGVLYPWRRGLIKDIDVANARIQVAVELDPTDIVFGFYSYRELDVIYRVLDVNPFTNPAVKNRLIEFYYKSNGADLFHQLYHQVKEPDGTVVAGLTNDPAPGTGTNHVFGQMVVGASVGTKQFTIDDIRQRGGGLSDPDIPEAANFWDLGYWDGKPYPIGGGLVVHLPSRILEKMSKADVEAAVQADLPAGAMPVIFYYDETGVESR